MYRCYKHPKYDYRKSIMHDCDYWKVIQQHRKLFKGVQDEYFEKDEFTRTDERYRNAKMTYVETVTLTFTIDQVNTNTKRVTIELPDHYTKLKEFAYKNLRFDSNCDYDIHYCSLINNGNYDYIDKIYGKSFKVLRHMYGIKDQTVIPFHFCADGNWLPIPLVPNFKLCFSLNNNKEFKLLVDVYELERDIYPKPKLWEKDTPRFDYQMMQCQHTGPELCSNKITKFRLDYNNPMTHLLLNLPAPFEKMILQFNGHDVITVDNTIDKNRYYHDDHKSCEIKDVEIYDNHYIIPFTKSKRSGINFSRIDNITLFIMWTNEFKLIDQVSVCNVYGLNLQGCTMQHGFFGLCFHG